MKIYAGYFCLAMTIVTACIVFLRLFYSYYFLKTIIFVMSIGALIIDGTIKIGRQ
jgi:hypothetical protein